jgi:hypothetical protein
MKNLFDLSFSKYIAPTAMTVIYVLVMVMLGIFYLIFVVSAFNSNAMFGMLVLLIVGPLVALLYLLLIRIGFESMLATIRIAQNTSGLVRLASAGQVPGQGAYTRTGVQGPYSGCADFPGEAPIM